MKSIFLIFLSLSLLFAAVSCTAQPLVETASQTETVLPSSENRFEEKITETAPKTNASFYSLSADNKTLKIVLEGNATTGFLWRWKTDVPDALVAVVDEYKPFEMPEGFVGGGGESHFEFTQDVKEEKTVLLSLEYARSWETVEPAETHTLSLRLLPNGSFTVLSAD